MRRIAITVMALGMFLLSAGTALAHVTIQPSEAVAGSFSCFVVRVPNEREDASTVKVEVKLPALAFVSFEDAIGWDRKEKAGEFDEPLEAFGQEITEGVLSVTWSGGEVQPGEFAEFGFSARMPDGDEDLVFEAVQTYSSGEVVEWAGAEDSEEPAPHLHAIPLPVEEGQGELAALAEIANRLDELEANSGTAAPAPESDAEEEDSDNMGTMLGIAGIALGLIALVVALRKPRSS